ncbi:unnamed protein product [Blepharisma stoltei]|uniref:PPM-type phosphatase domain-containing protein n=1 Tax=Blepharisma stoltei TaxID=1481888 RepID=A0AAU9IUJ7_9CILI|nr:unnamed protein product [Blepharisma stoltei]
MSKISKPKSKSSLRMEAYTPTPSNIHKVRSLQNFSTPTAQKKNVQIGDFRNKTYLSYQPDSLIHTPELGQSIFKPRKLPKLSINNPVFKNQPANSAPEKEKTSQSSSRLKPYLRQKTNISVNSAIKNHVISCTYKSRTGESLGKPKVFNQDSFIVKSGLKGVKGQYLFGICDGHGPAGHEVSRFIKEKFPIIFDGKFTVKNPDHGQIKEILGSSIRELAKNIDNSKIDVESSGSTLNSVFISGDKVVCGNIGDSRAVIGTFKERWLWKELSRDHKPSEEDEKERIISANGRVEPRNIQGHDVGPERVWLENLGMPGLAVSRSIGDRIAHRIGVSSVPEFTDHWIVPEDKFIIIASDGIWEFISSEEAVNIVGNTWYAGKSDKCCEVLVNEAVDRWSEHGNNVDDITILIIFLSFSNKRWGDHN